MQERVIPWALAATLVAWSMPGWAASDADKCEANKNKVAGKYYA